MCVAKYIKKKYAWFIFSFFVDCFFLFIFSSDEDMTSRYGSIDASLKSCINCYTYEKAGSLLIKYCSAKGESAKDFLSALETVLHDVKIGKDSHTGEKIQASLVHLLNKEILALARCWFGDVFATEIEELLEGTDDMPPFPFF